MQDNSILIIVLINECKISALWSHNFWATSKKLLLSGDTIYDIKVNLIIEA